MFCRLVLFSNNGGVFYGQFYGSYELLLRPHWPQHRPLPAISWSLLEVQGLIFRKNLSVV